MAEYPSIVVEISPGELIDKITILEIKARRISDPEMLRNVERERSILETARDQAIPVSKAIAEATERIRVGTNIANIYFRHPFLCAHTSSAIADLPN